MLSSSLMRCEQSHFNVLGPYDLWLSVIKWIESLYYNNYSILILPFESRFSSFSLIKLINSDVSLCILPFKISKMMKTPSFFNVRWFACDCLAAGGRNELYHENAQLLDVIQIFGIRIWYFRNEIGLSRHRISRNSWKYLE